MNKQKQGILIAADENVEWLLPWWWSHYQKYCTLPVAFVDLGMSHFGRSFCAEKGEYIPLNLEKRLPPAPIEIAEWEKLFGKEIWQRRKSWFKKVFAIQSTPFDRTLWLDIDCEVIKPIDPLFALPEGFYIAVETEASHKRERKLNIIFEDETLYNSGVLLYRKEEPLLKKWADALVALEENFFSDQHVLSRIIHQEKYPVQILNENYNWRMSQGFNIHAAIVHWSGSWGKEYIRRHGGVGDALAALPPI
jgi:hypothetical protein